MKFGIYYKSRRIDTIDDIAFDEKSIWDKVEELIEIRKED